MDYDGATDRAAIFERLRSFDDRGLDDDAFAALAMGLTDMAGATTPEAVLARHLSAFQASDRAAAAAQPGNGRPDLDAADAILENTFSFYGEAHTLGPDFDWERNPGTAHWGHDLNRFSFLNTLLQAYASTGNRRYAEKLVALVLAWIAVTDVCDAFIRTTPEAKRPDKSPYVWASYLNIAIHIELWGRVLSVLLTRCPDIVSAVDWLRILKSVHDQLWYLDLVIPETVGNWVTIGTRGQLATMSLLPGLRDTPVLANTAFERIIIATDAQILDDGAQYELTPHYHMVVIRNLDTVLAITGDLPVTMSAALWDLYVRAVRYMPHLISPDGKLVAFNDSDPGCGAGIRKQLESPRMQEALGEFAGRELTSTRFPDSGVMIMRQGSSRGPDELYLAFDGGPFGFSHQHEDALGFWLSAYGRSLIVDPGRHLYDSSPDSYRPHLILTQAHSTITIDNATQCARHAGRESWLDPAPQAARWQVAADGVVTAEANYPHGYLEVAELVTHTRRFTFVPDPGHWFLDDRVDGAGAHLVTSRFQFMPGKVVLDDGIAHSCYGDADLAVFFDPTEWDTVCVRVGEENPRQGWYSDGYNRIEPAPVLVFERKTALPFTPSLVLVPYRGGAVPACPLRQGSPEWTDDSF